MFSNKPVKIVGQNNKVIILYDRDKLTTKITVNGKIFDTSRINNKAVSEWVLPFSNDVTEWKGIFAEIDNFLGTNSYSIQFMGNTDDMRILMDNSPGGINITYRTPAAPKKSATSPVSKPTNTVSVFQTAQNSQKSQQPKSGDFSLKSEVSEHLLGAKEEFIKLKAKDKNLTLFCLISLGLVVVARLIQMIFIKESFLIQLTIIPVAIFSVFAYKKHYKSLAIAAIVSVLWFSFISYEIYDQRRLEKSWDDYEETMDEAMGKYNDLMDDYHNSINGSY